MAAAPIAALIALLALGCAQPGESLTSVRKVPPATTGFATPEAGAEDQRSAEREGEGLLPTPSVSLQPSPPRPLQTTEAGTVYLTRIEVVNDGSEEMDVPRIAVHTEQLTSELRAADPRAADPRAVDPQRSSQTASLVADREPCEVRSVATDGVPELEPGERRTIWVRSLCPPQPAPHQVRSFVQLPELLGEDHLYAGRAVVATPPGG